jgi:hypothetical protein
MPTLSAYCKAYLLERLARYSDWAEMAGRGDANSASEYVFLHDNFVVTRTMFLDEDVMFNRVTPEWIAFCKSELHFSVPEDVCRMNAPGEHGRRTDIATPSTRH